MPWLATIAYSSTETCATIVTPCFHARLEQAVGGARNLTSNRRARGSAQGNGNRLSCKSQRAQTARAQLPSRELSPRAASTKAIVMRPPSLAAGGSEQDWVRSSPCRRRRGSCGAPPAELLCPRWEGEAPDTCQQLHSTSGHHRILGTRPGICRRLRPL